MVYEQKYRALTATTLKKFVYGHFAKIGGRTIVFNADGEYDVDPETVGQFIRLHDKDGTEIYDGDRIDTPHDKGLVVGWNVKYASFCLYKNGWMFPHWFGEAVEPKNCVIVGNVYEIPESTKVDGTCDRCKADAGWYSDSAVYNPKTDNMDYKKIKITCPFCGRTFAALLSKFTKPIRHFWLDSDCECPAVEMESFCRKCGSKFTFKMSYG